jgi:hypothetical protein
MWPMATPVCQAHGVQIVETMTIVRAGGFTRTATWRRAKAEVEAAIKVAHWPFGSGKFTLNPDFGLTRSGKVDKHPNGVVPIKVPLRRHLEACGWVAESLPVGPKGAEGKPLLQTGDLDALLQDRGRYVGFEWETGNVSSSHRAINKMLDGILREALQGGILALPVRGTARYLTDRIGNFEEIAPYFEYWARYPITYGAIRVIGVGHDELDSSVPHIPKGTAGRALG